MAAGKDITFDTKWFSYSMIALGLGGLAAFLFIKLSLNYYLLILGGILFILFIYHRIEIGFGLLIATMLFEKLIFPEEIELSLTRVLSLPILFIALIKIFMDQKRFVFQKSKDSIVLFMFIWLILSVLRATDVEAALVSIATFAQLIFFYFVFKTIVDTEAQLQSVLKVTVLAGIGVAIFSILNDSGSLDSLQEVVLSERVTGSSNDPNKFAMGLIFILPISIYLFLTKQKMYLIAIVLFLFLLFGTLSRGGYAALAIVIILSIVQVVKSAPKGLVYSLSILSILATLFVVLNQENKISKRVESVQHHQEGSIKTRLELLQVAVDMGMKNPVFGVGVNNFRANSQFYGNQQHYERDAHNGFLEVFATLGIPGFLLLIGLIYFSLKDITRFQKVLNDKRGNQLNQQGDLFLAIFIRISFVGFLVTAFFLSLLAQKLFWTLIAFSSILHKCSLDYQE